MSRIAVIKRSKCNPAKCDYLCIKLCPVNRTGGECITKGEDTKPYIEEDLCNGCHICVARCPLEALDIVNLPEALKEPPIHRYGRNAFQLFNLPIPKPGKVIGIIGRNGIGKTTALNILSGNLIPQEGKEATIKRYSTSPLGDFFKKLYKNKIKLAYKPQRVEQIPENFDGKVKDLLKKVDEKNKLKEYTELLEIDKILDTNIKEISGGELQRVAIAAAALKDAQVIYFDEPSSYLDIKQRLKIAQFIRTLANENTAVIVVEHDLVTLDYMADLIHIVYGKPSVYGVISGLKSSRPGINTYLSGFLREENIRFRDKEIKFCTHAHSKQVETEEIAQWPKMQKKLGNFNLDIQQGSIRERQVVGILGSNGIGKTSFMKLLAGEIKPDQLEVDLKLKISYKPQYLKSESEETVEQLLKKETKEYNTKSYKAMIISPLEIDHILQKQVKTLSGGELQRVSIALCLSRESDLILMDEPSAYLDIEQRLTLAKTINKVIETKEISALIIDHDLVFMDSLSQGLLVFEGEPAVKGILHKPLTMEDGMNKLLKELKITMRRDEENQRPRINKLASQMDKKQKKENKYYYS